MGVWSEDGEWGLAKGYSLDVRKQMVQRVDGRLRVRGGVIMVRQNKAFLDHVFSLLFEMLTRSSGTHPPYLKGKLHYLFFKHPLAVTSVSCC